MESKVLPMPSKSHSQATSKPSKDSLISEWLTRFSLNAGAPLDDKTRAVYLSMWKDGFADVEADRLQAAFVACLRSHTFRTMPTIGDVRQHLQKAEGDAAQLEAEQKWTQVLRYIESTSPDYPSRQKISERTMTAIRAAGGIDWIRECPREQLVWCQKKFVESYLRWEQVKQEQFLLPDGPIKDAIRALADSKQRQLTEGKVWT